MLGAPPAFILSQDRTLRSSWTGVSRFDVSGRSVPSIDPADLGFAEIDVSEHGSEIRISLVCLVDLSIAVSGFQGSPRRSEALGSLLRGELLYALRGPARARIRGSTIPTQVEASKSVSKRVLVRQSRGLSSGDSRSRPPLRKLAPHHTPARQPGIAKTRLEFGSGPTSPTKRKR